VFFILYDKI